MDGRFGRSIIHAGSPIFFVALVSVPLLYIQVHPGLMLLLLGMLWSCGSIASIIRWINVRADSQHSEEPPDDHVA
jgi:hypothetical protein